MLFAIGDIHGCADELRLLLNKLPLTPDCTVVFIGDYVDRGPKSREVIETVLELRELCNVVALSGNHEDMFRHFLADPLSARAASFIYNGGSATLASYANEAGEFTIPEHHVEFLHSLELKYETDHYLFVHAGLPEVPIDKINDRKHGREMMWTRGKFLRSEYDWKKVVVHGHTPTSHVQIRENRINLDTGCVFGRRLSALALPGERIISVPRQKRTRPVYLRDINSTRAAIRFRGTAPVAVAANEGVFHFETVDYSELGMYMRDVERSSFVFETGQRVRGIIGDGNTPGLDLIDFDGRIVRRKQDDQGIHYGVRLLTTRIRGETGELPEEVADPEREIEPAAEG